MNILLRSLSVLLLSVEKILSVPVFWLFSILVIRNSAVFFFRPLLLPSVFFSLYSWRRTPSKICDPASGGVYPPIPNLFETSFSCFFQSAVCCCFFPSPSLRCGPRFFSVVPSSSLSWSLASNCFQVSCFPFFVSSCRCFMFFCPCTNPLMPSVAVYWCFCHAG